jgi:hypothetical protein
MKLLLAIHGRRPGYFGIKALLKEAREEGKGAFPGGGGKGVWGENPKKRREG